MQYSYTFTLSRHVFHVFTLVPLSFTSVMQPFLLSQRFLLWCSFSEQQCVQEAIVRLLLVFLQQQSHLLCWGFASLVHLVLPWSVFYLFTLFWIYICFQQYFFAAVCSGGISLITYQLHCQTLFCCLSCSVLQCILQCNVMYCSALQCSLQSFHCSLLTCFDFLVLLCHNLQIPVLNI